MKCVAPSHVGIILPVRPLAGAGIEIKSYSHRQKGGCVRPLAGAGIEIGQLTILNKLGCVRPLAGAGIEIAKLRAGRFRPPGSPPRGGGN